MNRSRFLKLLWILTSLSLICPLSNAVSLSQRQSTISALAWNRDNTRIALGRVDGSIEVKDLTTGDSIFLGQSVKAITSIAWSPVDAEIVAVSHDAPYVRIFNSRTGERLFNLFTDGEMVNRVAWNADGTLLAVAANVDQLSPVNFSQLQVWNPQTGERVYTADVDDGIADIDWSPVSEDNRLVSASFYGAAEYGSDIVPTNWKDHPVEW